MTTADMSLYAIFRRHGWEQPEDLEAADDRSNAELAKRSDQVRKIRSYILQENDGALGTICVYQASSPEAVQEHAEAADLPCNEIVEVDTIDVARPDPEPVTAG